MIRTKFFTILALFALAACSNHSNTISATDQPAQPTLTPLHLYSASFKEGDTLSPLYTCDSSNVSPELHWNNPFNNTASFAIIVDDPDAPIGTVVHWILYNIPANDTVIHASTPCDSVLPNGAKQGAPTSGRLCYGGPCPPKGTHHYHFKLYALDAPMRYPAGLTKKKLLDAMKGHILAETELVGLYKRKK